MLIEPSDIEDAARRIRRWLSPTPIIRSRHLSEKLGANVYLKLETLQPTHSFKVRGAFNALERLDADARPRGVITASGGNHGLAVAFAAKSLSMPATVYLPEKTTRVRIDAIEHFGARVVLHGAAWDDAHARALREAAKKKIAYIHPFDNGDVMAGQGTIVSELVEQLPNIHLLLASIGGGGLLSGMLSAVKAFTPQTRVIGVETEGADCMYRSWKAGHIVELEKITSIAETLGARKTETRQFDIISKHVCELVTVSDDQAIRALLELLGEEKLLTEPASACSVAALLEKKAKVRAGENVVIVLCGANIAIDRVGQWAIEHTGRRLQKPESTV